MMGIYSPTLVILVSGVWHASQWKPKWINVFKPHVIFQWFTCVCCTPDGQLLMPCSALYLQASHKQNNEDLEHVCLSRAVENRCQCPLYEVDFYCFAITLSSPQLLYFNKCIYLLISQYFLPYIQIIIIREKSWTLYFSNKWTLPSDCSFIMMILIAFLTRT